MSFPSLNPQGQIQPCSPEQLAMTKLQVARHLLCKRWLLLITNICNLSCGGCNEMCGLFAKDQLWYLPLSEIDQQITWMKRYKAEITIIGGEPTMHPQWEQIVDLLYQHSDVRFRVNTNGRKGHEPFSIPDRGSKNVQYYVDLHPDGQTFFPGILAACDVQPLESDAAYWEKAQKDCPIWMNCGTSVYQGKAYFCEHAAAFDWMYHQGANGWPIEEGKNPFVRTADEVAEQARKFCYRCGWCMFPEIDRTQQEVQNPTLVTETNLQGIGKPQLVQLMLPQEIKRKDGGQ